jgi:hypothetical protein
MNKQEFGELLNNYLNKYGYDVVKISRWTYKIYTDYLKYLDPSMMFILECLFRMEDDPQFEFTEEELRLIADRLINNDEDPFKGLLQKDI